MDMYWSLVLLLTAHWFADFVCQTSWQAQNKSKSLWALTSHVLTYFLVLSTASFILFQGSSYVGGFVVLNGIIHWWTDFFTSRITSRLWAAQRWHDFFVVVGLDQLIHQVTLALTAWWLFG